jgi:chitinase
MRASRSSISNKHRSALTAVLASAVIVAGASAAIGAGPSTPAATRSNNTTGAASTSGGLKVAYYDQWSIYQNAYYLKNVDQTGAASNLNYLIYDFENIDPTNLTCFETTKATDPDPGGESDPNAGDGAEDQFADYQKSFDSSISVDGTSDVYNQPIAGNFHQLQELKAKHPNLKVLLSIGGWTYSKYFSDVAATQASRQKFVSSCIDMFIKGNIPASSGYGGPGTAANIFDGFDIDWEYPASTAGHLGNHESAADKANYTALLQEFRTELNAQGSATGKTYALSAALPSGQEKIAAGIETQNVGNILTFGDAMTYDMHGAWDATGPTNHQAPIYSDPNDPMSNVPPGNAKYNLDEAIKAYTVGDPSYGIPGGFPAGKLNIGIPFYYRGWTGVSAGSAHGLFQAATGPAAGAADSGNVPGIQMYKELTGIVNNSADTYWDPVAEAAYFYDGTNFWSGEDPQSIQAKADYLHCNGLGGAMMFSLYDLDPGATLFNDAVNDVNGAAASCPTGPPSSSSSSSSPTTPPTTPTTPSSTPPTTPTTPSTTPTTPSSSSSSSSGGGNGIQNAGFESGSLSPWACTSNSGAVQSATVHGGSHALQATPSSSDDAQCSQTVTVKPNTAYTLSAWVNGPYTYVGVTGSGSDSSTWTSGSTWSQLSTKFTTGASVTSVTVWVHGWYGQSAYYADDFALS